MSFVLKIGNKNISVPLNKPTQLWLRKEFNPRLPLVLMVTGWTTNFNETESPALDVIYAAYRCRGNVNFVVYFNFKLIFFFFIRVKNVFPLTSILFSCFGLVFLQKQTVDTGQFVIILWYNFLVIRQSYNFFAIFVSFQLDLSTHFTLGVHSIRKKSETLFPIHYKT